VILLPNTELEDACLLAGRIRIAISQSLLMYGEERLSATVSIGVAAINDKLANSSELLSQADLALFPGKKSDRNKVCV
jgi:two-component system cell cycle response regulator